jgi:hypothetical protein
MSAEPGRVSASGLTTINTLDRPAQVKREDLWVVRDRIELSTFR